MTKKKQRTANISLAKAGQLEVIEHLYFYQHLCYIWADCFQRPAFAKPRHVARHTTENHTAEIKLNFSVIKETESKPNKENVERFEFIFYFFILRNRIDFSSE